MIDATGLGCEMGDPPLSVTQQVPPPPDHPTTLYNHPPQPRSYNEGSYYKSPILLSASALYLYLLSTNTLVFSP